MKNKYKPFRKLKRLFKVSTWFTAFKFNDGMWWLYFGYEPKDCLWVRVLTWNNGDHPNIEKWIYKHELT